MVQLLDRTTSEAREDLRRLLAVFRRASADLRQEVVFARERRTVALRAADDARTAAKLTADKAFSRITALYEGARATLTETSKLSKADHQSRLELLMGGFSGLGEPASAAESDPASEIAAQAERAEVALRYIRTMLGTADQV